VPLASSTLNISYLDQCSLCISSEGKMRGKKWAKALNSSKRALTLSVRLWKNYNYSPLVANIHFSIVFAVEFQTRIWSQEKFHASFYIWKILLTKFHVLFLAGEFSIKALLCWCAALWRVPRWSLSTTCEHLIDIISYPLWQLTISCDKSGRKN
jgi:hypothetical protein